MANLSRQELYDKVKETSKDEYILSEMKRLGYWKEDGKPSVAETLIKRKGELQKEINRLSSEISDPKAALKAIHQQRMAEARQRRIDTKVKHDVERYQRAQAWHKTKQQSLNYLGDACILKTNNTDETSGDQETLEKAGLPGCQTATELAEAMGVTLNELRFLCFTNQVSKTSHYQHFGIQKKTGGVRYISAPMPRLKRLQYWVLDNVLQKIPLSPQAHGFVAGRSIVTNAYPHVGQQVVINMDLKDFFPTISYPRIKGLFLKQGYNDGIATLLTLICSEPDTETVEMDGQRYHIHNKQRYLPQGAPTSPALSNLICRRLDKRLQGLADKYDFTYTRYADDLTFSSPHKRNITSLLNWVKLTIKEEGFVIHPDKTRIMHAGSRQEVTGIVVNQQLSINRKTLKQFRALLFQLRKDGYDGKHWHKNNNLLAVITGFAHYIRMVNPPKGAQFLEQIAEIKRIHGLPAPQQGSPIASSNTAFRQAAAKGELPLPGMKVAQPPPAPKLEQCIHHHDVLEQIRETLGIEPECEPISPENQSGITATDTPPELKSNKGLLATIRNLFGGKS